MKQLTIKLFCSLIFLSFVGCGAQKPATLADLKYKPEKEKKIDFDELNYEEVRAEYQQLLKLIPEKELIEQIERRIAEVYMIEGEQKQIASKPSKSYTMEAIKSFNEILLKYPNSPDNADVLYQLARAYDLDGNLEAAEKTLVKLTTRHPNYKYISEAHFRLGDIYFGDNKWARAQREYYSVARSSNNKLKIYSHYMLAWSYYKQFKYDAALDSFSYVLNRLMRKIETNKKLSKTEKPLVEDTLHSMSLALSNFGGATSIEQIKRLQGKKHIWMIYDNLGEYYLKKQRYEDSASTFRQYVTKYNYAEQAPNLHSKLIKTYIKGKFPKEALKEKETYVEYYGLDSLYAKNVGGIKQGIKKQLKIYINELAKHYHSQGQQFQKEISVLKNKVKVKAKLAKIEEYDKKAIESYEKAATYYQKYITTFPKDKMVGELTFSKAEVLFSARRYAYALVDYEKVAYKIKQPSAKKYQANAGYAAIISYQKHIEELPKNSDAQKKWQAKAVESMLRFASTFYQDKRSASVLTNAAEYLFTLNQYKKALKVSTDLVSKNPTLDKSLKKTAYGIMAHSQFNLGNYQEAEKNYINQRALTRQTSKEYRDITERLANSIYKKSEGLIASKNQTKAVEELLKIKKLAPDASVRIVAQYDAATMLIGLKKWSKAIIELKDLMKNYPKHKLAIEFPRKLAFAYEKNKQYALAATAYIELTKNDPDQEIKRDALFIAAGLYKKIKNYEEAIQLYKRYARKYEQPFDNRMEARYQLAVLYETKKDFNRQLFWLRRIVDGDKKGGGQRTDRSRWLGAWANIKYGDYFASEFRRLKLRQPLTRSLPKKNEALKGATDRYQMAADYRILEFVTMSAYKIAELYELFATQLRQSPKPRGLSSAERKAYAEIIEEQAGPFDNLAIELHQGNVERAWSGEFDQWIDKSFKKMMKAQPGRFNKQEIEVSYGDEIY